MQKPSSSKRKCRQTLAKKIAAAQTHAKKWAIALHGGEPPSAIERLTQDAMSLQHLLLDRHLAKTYKNQLATWKDDLKSRFADLLFPALLEDRPEVFFELLDAMAHQRRLFKGQQKTDGGKKVAGHRLRLAILSLAPDDLRSMATVLNQLEDWNVNYSDESHVRRVMREVGVHILRPGQQFVWSDIAGHVVRKMRVIKGGTIVAEPETLQGIHINPIRCVELIPRGSTPVKEPDK